MNAQYGNKLPFDSDLIFNIQTAVEFNAIAIQVFQFQYANNSVYREFCDHLNVDFQKISDYKDIPFLPIEFFKTKQVVAFNGAPEKVFLSSGTTGTVQSKHYVKHLSLYEKSFTKAFELQYGSISDYLVLGLLPSYLEREGSSLIYMVEKFIQKSAYTESGFFLNEYEKLNDIIKANRDKKILLLGVAYALLDFGAQYHPDLSGCVVMETGGMKGKRKELIKSDLHSLLKRDFNVDQVHSEYGMTELLSQAYSEGLKFKCPPWMKILTRSYTDPFQLVSGKTGGMNIIDLANLFSCSFIASQDLGHLYPDHFEVLGRFDNSDIRGCNLLID